MSLSPELVERVKVLWERYPEKKAALLPALHLIQKEREGWLSDETIAAINARRVRQHAPTENSAGLKSRPEPVARSCRAPGPATRNTASPAD